MLLDCAQILKGSGFFWRVRVPSAGSWGGSPGRGWVGAAGVGATASLGMAEGGWLGESVWVLRWLHTLCWELLWLSFLSNWCWVDRKQREVYVRVKHGGGYKQEMKVEGRQRRKKSESDKWVSDKGEIEWKRDEWEKCWWRTKKEKATKVIFFRHCSGTSLTKTSAGVWGEMTWFPWLPDKDSWKWEEISVNKNIAFMNLCLLHKVLCMETESRLLSIETEMCKNLFCNPNSKTLNTREESWWVGGKCYQY